MSLSHEASHEETTVNPEPKATDHYEWISNYLKQNWKIVLVTGTSVTVLILAVFLITFFAAREPCTPVAPSTVSPTTSGTTHRISDGPTTTTKAFRPTTTKQNPVSPTPFAPHNLTCFNHFDMVNGKCWKFIGTVANRVNADITCRGYGGSTLVTIRNEQENEELLNYTQKFSHPNVTTIWTGLSCLNNTNTSSSCVWDFESGTAKEYNNFETGFPNTDYGKCVYYSLNGSSVGKWKNTECTNTMPLVCELPSTTYDDCNFNYNNYCYVRFNMMYNISDAQRYCESRCSNMVSIHSANENRYIWASVYPNLSGSIRLGLVASSEDYVIWLDGSPVDYTNFKRTYGGACAYIELATAHDGGDWAITECTKPNWFLCKHRPGVTC